MYEQGEVRNDRATGVCFNNIANLHLKTGKYKSAALNFEAAIDRATLCKAKCANNKQQQKYFDRIYAHRKYQLAITRYKALKFGQSKSLEAAQHE